MRKVCFIILSLFFIAKIYSQTYVPMPMHNCFWTVSHDAQCTWLVPGAGSSFETYTIYPTTDTIINSTRYIKFYLIDHDTSTGAGCMSYDQRNSGYWGGVRQDTANQKVYKKLPGNGSEVLYYNFDYNIGDTMKNVYMGGYGGPAGACRIIKNITYQNFSDGICRRVYTFKYPCYYSPGSSGMNYTLYDKLIEGYGMNTGFDNMYASANMGSNLQEFYGNGLFINNQQIQLATSTNTCVQYIGLKENSNSIVLKIFPNPANDEINISSERTGLYYVIYNVVGKEMLRFNGEKADIRYLDPGTYFIKCFDPSTKEVFVKKVIKYQ